MSSIDDRRDETFRDALGIEHHADEFVDEDTRAGRHALRRAYHRARRDHADAVDAGDDHAAARAGAIRRWLAARVRGDPHADGVGLGGGAAYDDYDDYSWRVR